MRRDDDSDDRPTAKKKKKNAGNSMTRTLLLVGGGAAVLLSCCCTFSIGGYFLFQSVSAPDVVGRWEGHVDAGFLKMKHAYEFRGDRTGTEETLVVTHFDYRQSGSNLTITYTGVGNMKAQGIKVNGRSSVTFTVRREGDTLTLIDDAQGVPLTLKKVR